MRKLGIGVYLDPAGAMHVATQELCDYFGVPYTAENAAIAERGALDAIKQMWPELRGLDVVEHAE